MFTFIGAGILRYNNRAERTVRPGVITRKITGGSSPRKGERNNSAPMSVRETREIVSADFYAFGVEWLSEGSSKAARRAAAGPASGGGVGPSTELTAAGQTASKPRAVVHFSYDF